MNPFDIQIPSLTETPHKKTIVLPKYANISSLRPTQPPLQQQYTSITSLKPTTTESSPQQQRYLSTSTITDASDILKTTEDVRYSSNRLTTKQPYNNNQTDTTKKSSKTDTPTYNRTDTTSNSYKEQTNTTKEQSNTQKFKLTGYTRTKDVTTTKLGTHIKYFKKDGSTWDERYRKGGFLKKIDEKGRYIILTSNKIDWSAQIKDNDFFVKKPVERKKQPTNKKVIANKMIAQLDMIDELKAENERLRKLLKTR